MNVKTNKRKSKKTLLTKKELKHLKAQRRTDNLQRKPIAIVENTLQGSDDFLYRRGNPMDNIPVTIDY